ncbi:MAG: hypothetical protein ACC634_10065, partial [Hyphomicrobiales bacterium]
MRAAQRTFYQIKFPQKYQGTVINGLNFIALPPQLIQIVPPDGQPPNDPTDNPLKNKWSGRADSNRRPS